MNTNFIIKNNERLNNCWKATGKACDKLSVLEGALAEITKFWNKGFNLAAKELGFGKPSELCAFVSNSMKNHEFHDMMYGIDKKGDEFLGLWKRVKLEDKSVEPIVDAKGRDTYPYLRDEQGKIVEQDQLKPITRWSPKIVFELLLQNEYANMQDKVRDVLAENGLDEELTDALAARAVEKMHAENLAK